MINTTRHTPWRQRAAARMAAAVAVCCALTTAPAHADEKSDALLAKVKAAYKDAISLTGILSVSTSQGKYKRTEFGTFQLRKPNFVRVMTAPTQTDPLKMTVSCDGKNLYELGRDNQYRKGPADLSVAAIGRSLKLGGLAGELFFGKAWYGFGGLAEPGVVKKYEGKETVDGEQYDVVSLTGNNVAHTLKIYVGADGLIGRAISVTFVQPTLKRTSEWRRLKTNPVPPTEDFAFTLPKGAKLLQPDRPDPPDYESKLVAVGKTAPVFALPGSTGATVSLADSIAEHKAVLVNFWFYG